ncbi:DNA methyltransferase [Helicobacter sp. MIT 21-1697]|uniref:DNA methyltransferase n=1 Tax=Helicobacter sp. MIT 21-1697 TaxID=2993733 RepID=UPI00224AC4D2|nr:DNA methyltransferase [Helicobacter sp. MIT 21-1697]MCX2717429.1 DNA methyltransferase [Helicobacter sp. MIT 21-1697]
MTQILQNSIDDLLYPRKLDKIHPYPAKFTIDLAAQYIKKYSRENDVVLDPFCGSGTTLLASRLLKRQSIGLDINFIAVLISQFKLLNLNKKDIQELQHFIINPLYQTTKFHSYDNITHWFKQESIKALSSIKEQIYNYAQNNEKYMTFLQLIFSSIINIASNQDSDTRYASIEKPYIDEKYIFAKFNEKLKNALEIYQNIYSQDFKQSQVFLHNAKQLTQKINKNSISLIFTSPPYPNTYDYYLYHKHRMLWLDYDVKFSMSNEIGSRREYSSLKLPKEKFNNDLMEIFTQCNKVLKQNGMIGIVMGDGKIAGNIYNAKDEILEIATKLHWDLLDYSFSELDKTSRSFAQSYRTKNKKEHILVFARNSNAN